MNAKTPTNRFPKDAVEKIKDYLDILNEIGEKMEIPTFQSVWPKDELLPDGDFIPWSDILGAADKARGQIDKLLEALPLLRKYVFRDDMQLTSFEEWQRTAPTEEVFTLDTGEVISYDPVETILDINEGEERTYYLEVADSRLRDWLDEHEQQCRASLELWMLRSLPVPRDVLASVWTDPAWQSILINTVVCAFKKGELSQSEAGFLKQIETLGRMFIHADLDKRHQGQPQRAGVQERDITVDQTHFLQLTYTAQARRGRKANGIRQLLIGDASILLQLFQDQTVVAVEFHSVKILIKLTMCLI